MKAPLLFPIIFAAFAFSLPTHANGLPGQKQPISISPIHAEDTRIDLKFTTAERAIFLADMRNMLGSIQEILQGIGSSNREEIIEANILLIQSPGSITLDLVIHYTWLENYCSSKLFLVC